MSLLRLLSAGKSLVGLKDVRSRYHLSSRELLPKFVSKANPFRVSTRPEPALFPAAPVNPETENIVPDSQEPRGGSNSTSNSVIPALAGKGHLPSPSLTSPRDGTRAPSLNHKYGEKWKALCFWLRPQVTKLPMPRFPKPLVQSELSLDGVKVVRNDLSDSDLEIVRAKPPAPTQDSGLSMAETTPSPASGWSRATDRTVGAGKI